VHEHEVPPVIVPSIWLISTIGRLKGSDSVRFSVGNVVYLDSRFRKPEPSEVFDIANRIQELSAQTREDLRLSEGAFELIKLMFEDEHSLKPTNDLDG
jgi:hypothetical protein